MTDFQEFTFLSSDGRTQLHGAQWTPADREPIAVLQIAHGVAEHILRYDDFARYLNDRGILVAGHDHLGHGKSLPEGGTPVYFGDGSTWETVVDDIHLLHDRLREQYPRLPILLMGHSMGSFLSRSYLIRYPGTVDAAIIMGTGHQSPAIVAGGRAIAKAAGKRHGFKAHSPRVEALAFGAYNKAFAPNRTEVDWLSASDNNVDAYIADPLCGQKASIGLFYEMLGGIRFISAMGAGNKLDPSCLRIADITKTSVCPLARAMRVSCKKKGIRHMTVAYSLEPMHPPVQPIAEESGRRKDIPGSTAFVPGAMGLLIASHVVRTLMAGDEPARPEG